MEPLFLDGSAGRLFALYQAGAAHSRGSVIYVPPFAEEMNRSRRMAALQARAFAEMGFGVLVLDLYGTGESDGDFRDARWEIWLEDLAAAAEFLARRGNPARMLWGLRLGALLAVSFVKHNPGPFERLLLWQPVTDGNAMLTQFLRIRIAAAMETGQRETTERLRAEFAAGRSLEIAGYELSPELFAAIGRARIEENRPAAGTRVDWLELGAPGQGSLSAGGARVTSEWRESGLQIEADIIPGDPFWSLQETTLAPELLSATRARCAGTSP